MDETGVIERMFDSTLDQPSVEGGWAVLSDMAQPGWDPSGPEYAFEPVDAPLPYSAAGCRPSGWLALELDTATADTDRLDDTDLVEAIVGFDRLASWAAARQARLLAEFARRRPGDDPWAVMEERPSLISRYAPDEIGLALHLSRGAAIARLGQSVQLATALTHTREAWEQGLVDGPKLRAICEATVFLPAESAAAVQDRVLDRAGEQSLPQLKAALGRAIIAIDPEGAAARHREARRDRRVAVGQEQDGMASL